MQVVDNILAHYQSCNPGVLANLRRILNHGHLAGTGKLMILPVDQGFEHGPDRSFAVNPDSYDPLYHIELAIEAGLSAYAAPLGMIEIAASKYAGRIPLILKMNSSNSLMPSDQSPHQAITSSVQDALRLGCSAVGFTIYPGSSNSLNMFEQIQKIAEQAKRSGLAVVIWSYPRGADLSPQDQTAIDITSYAAHIASLLGAHIVKVKLPNSHISISSNKAIYQEQQIATENLVDRVKHVCQSCFAAKRMVVFSGGIAKDRQAIIEEAKAICQAGGNGSIIGRNVFQRERNEALNLLAKIIDIYKGNND